MGLIILPGQNDFTPQEHQNEEIYWLAPFNYKGFFVQAGRYKGKYKMYAKTLHEEVDRKGKIIQPDFESGWHDYYADAQNEIQKYINSYRGSIITT